MIIVEVEGVRGIVGYWACRVRSEDSVEFLALDFVSLVRASGFSRGGFAASS